MGNIGGLHKIKGLGTLCQLLWIMPKLIPKNLAKQPKYSYLKIWLLFIIQTNFCSCWCWRWQILFKKSIWRCPWRTWYPTIINIFYASGGRCDRNRIRVSLLFQYPSNPNSIWHLSYRGRHKEKQVITA